MSSKAVRQILFKKKLEEEYQVKQGRKYPLAETDYISKVNPNATVNNKEATTKTESDETEVSLNKKREYRRRAAHFSEMKKKRMEEKRRSMEVIEALEENTLWLEFEGIIRENQLAVKGLENYKVTVEIAEKEEKINGNR